MGSELSARGTSAVARWRFAALATGFAVLACARGLPVAVAADGGMMQAPPTATEVVAPEPAQPELTPLESTEPGVVRPDAAAADAQAGLLSDSWGPITAPNLLRVGLATDLEEIVLPCCQTEVVAEADGRLLAMTSTLRVKPIVPPGEVGGYRLQVAALKDELQAEGLAERLVARGAASPVDVVFDAAVDLYRVRVGRFKTRPEAEAAQRTLAGLGVGSSWLVSERAGLGAAGSEVGLIIESGGHSSRLGGRWLRVRPRNGDGILTAQGRFRGNILVYLNDRGALNLINELPLEEYLRGVVPRELGPAAYPNLDALKAQAVAARTYTVRNLGEFAGEGYDICATPRCQVYAGMDAEHQLSDRAIAETAGEILVHSEQPVDALYSSTCGGHTEDVSVIFPLKEAEYLRGVPCLEGGFDRLPAGARRGQPFPAGLTRQLFPQVGSTEHPDALAARLVQLAQRAGLPIPRDRLRTLERREVQRYIASLFDLALNARLFVAPADIDYLLRERPDDWSEADLRLATYLVQSGLLAGDPGQPLTEAQIEATLLRLGLSLHLFEERRVHYLSLEEGRLQVREDGETRDYRTTESTVAFRGVGAPPTTGDLALLAGDRIDLYLDGDEVLAVVHFVESAGANYDRSSRMSSWTRFFTDAQLADSVHARYPGLGFTDFEVLDRGVSGRVGSIRLRGANGSEQEVEGLAVRWTLDVPDTLFTVKRLQPPGRASGWLFEGRGWGHGVGMCQVGAYGMGLRGHGYREILTHYYRGVAIEQLQLVDRWTSEPIAAR